MLPLQGRVPPHRGHNNGHARGGSAGQQRCMRWLRWALPLALTALLSSYATYLVLGSLHAGQHSFVSVTRGHRATQQPGGQHPSSSSSLDAAPAVAAAATAAGAVKKAGGKQAAAAALPHPKFAPQDAAQRWLNATGRRLRVAVVNEAPYHLEIVAGLLHVLGGLPVDITWYQAAQVSPDGRLSPTELVEKTGFTQLLGFLPAMRPSDGTPARCDYAILVSPEYFEKQTQAWLAAARPITAVALAHNGMNTALRRIQALHPRLHFSALSPHVAAASRHALRIHTHWMLPTWPIKGKASCKPGGADAASCLDGFGVQGNFEAARRNYTRLWQQVQRASAAGRIPTEPPARRFHLHLVGRGDVATLRMPEAVKGVSTVHFNLRFPEYYAQLQRTHGLLMLLGNVNYLIQKMSSTVVSSLMTGVPVVADAQVLASYTFLSKEHVFLMAPHEGEVDVMLRVLRTPPDKVLAMRAKVAELAATLNRRSALLLQAFMPLEEDAALAAPLA